MLDFICNMTFIYFKNCVLIKILLLYVTLFMTLLHNITKNVNHLWFIDLMLGIISLPDGMSYDKRSTCNKMWTIEGIFPITPISVHMTVLYFKSNL